jgi:hypothetical protein
MRRFRLQIIALLAVLGVLVSGGSWAGAQYLCHMTGRVVSECCCDAAGPAHRPLSLQQARAANCCERIAHEACRSATSSADVSNAVVGPALVAVLPPFSYTPPAAQLVELTPAWARGPPAAGPPLFLAHCALLI